MSVRHRPSQTVLPGTQRARPVWSAATLLSGLGQYGVDAGLIFCQADTLGRVGLRLAPGLRLALGVFAVAGHGSLVLDVGIPHCLPDSPDEVFELTSRDVEPDPPVWVDPHLALVPVETHPMMELPEPGGSTGWSFHGLARLQPTVISSSTSPSPGSLMARIPVTVQGSSPRASGELTMPFILPDALAEDRNALPTANPDSRGCERYPCPALTAFDYLLQLGQHRGPIIPRMRHLFLASIVVLAE